MNGYKSTTCTMHLILIIHIQVDPNQIQGNNIKLIVGVVKIDTVKMDLNVLHEQQD